MSKGKISLILPYWDRQAATDESLRLMMAAYGDMNLEVIIVDDGSPEPYRLPGSLTIDVKLARLPEKSGPKNSCLPYNIGAGMATGDYIALSSPEMLHDVPILGAMRAECIISGENAYVMAACWCPDQQKWHCHSSMKRPTDASDVGAFLPPNANYHFMTMMGRNLWEKTGGFDPDYRDGAGFEDPDFVMRLGRAGAKFIMRDDLVVRHPRKGARSAWTLPMFDRNREVFYSKWKHVRPANVEKVA